jgi:AraC family transcriptional regulator
VATPGDAERIDVPGGQYVCYRLAGSYHGIPDAFTMLYRDWFPESGFVPDDRPSLEIYRNNPFDTPESALITDLMIPIRRA